MQLSAPVSFVAEAGYLHERLERSTLYQLEHGLLALMATGEARDVVVGLIIPGDFFSLPSGSPLQLYAQLHSRVVFVPHPEPGLIERNLAAQLHRQYAYAEIAQHPIPKRVPMLLDLLATWGLTEVDGEGGRYFTLTHAQLGYLTNAARESVSAALGALTAGKRSYRRIYWPPPKED